MTLDDADVLSILTARVSAAVTLSLLYCCCKLYFLLNGANCDRLTPQLKELELVHKRFRDSGLVVLGVPSNDFGEQEVGVLGGGRYSFVLGRDR